MKYIAYVDGSYRQIQGIGRFYGGAAIITKDEDKCVWVSMSTAGGEFDGCTKDDMVQMRNVAGEITSAVMLFEHCLRLGDCDELEVHYDYEGIHNWLKGATEPGYWRAKNQWTKAYRDYYYSHVKPRIKCSFIHVKGHSGDAGNELVDSLAKQAIETHILNKK